MGGGIRPKNSGSAYCKRCARRKIDDDDFNSILCKCCSEGKKRCAMQFCDKYATWEAIPKNNWYTPAYYCDRCKYKIQENNKMWKEINKM